MEILSALAISLGLGISTGIKYFIAMFMGYLGLHLASKTFGPLKLFEK